LPITLTVREGETGVLTIGASSADGSALSYRWLRNGVELASAGSAATATVPTSVFNTSYPSETWQVEVRNASGAVLSGETTVNRVSRAWRDAGTAHPGQDYANLGSPGQLVSFTDPAGRVHIASTHSRSGVGSFITFKGHSKETDADPWAYDTAIAADNTSVRISHIGMSSTWTGEVIATWLETNIGSGVPDRQVVRAALYRPGASASAAGSWSLIGTVSDAALEADQPTVVTIGAGVFGIAWLQRSAPGQPRDAVLRLYNVPASSATLDSGLGSMAAMEAQSADITRLQLMEGGGRPVAFMFVEGSGGAADRWQYSIATNWTTWPTAADLGLDQRYEQLHWAASVNGRTVLAAADGSNRLYTRRVNFTEPGLFESDWAYTANAYGSAPALLIDAEGRIDVFGVSVNGINFNSVLGHWTFTPSVGWGSATLLAQSATDFRNGLGLRAPVAGRDGSGNLVLAWLDKPSESVPESLKAMRYSRFAASWTEPVFVAPASNVSRQHAPTLQVNEQGQATAAWAEVDAEEVVRVKHARLR
jgi:hypothetical protein